MNDKFDKLCESYYEEILKYVRRKIGYQNHHDAYDVTNKVFLILTENKTALKMDAPTVRSYIYSIATKSCLNYLQSAYKKKKHEVELGDDIINIPDEDTAQVNANELFEHIMEQSSLLAPKERELFHGYWIEKKKLSDIAEKQNASYDSIKKASSRLKRKLMLILQEYFE